jgi:hypothetical protein
MAYPRSVMDNWKQTGRLFFWRFTENTRNFPGWHFMVDRAASISIAALLRSMSKSASSCSRTIVVSLPTTEVLSIPNNRNSQCVAPERIRIESGLSASEAWTLVEDGALVHWRLGTQSMRKLADVFADPAKYFDSTVGQEPVLWCWGVLAQSPSNKSPKRPRAR